MEMLTTPHFYMLYMMMLMIVIGGLMATAQVAPVAGRYGVGSPALLIALSLNPLTNGGGRIFWGWVSDHAGRENTIFIAFALQAVFLASIPLLGPVSSVWFVALMAMVSSRGANCMRCFRPCLPTFSARAIRLRTTAFSTPRKELPPSFRGARPRRCLKKPAPGIWHFTAALRWRCAQPWQRSGYGGCRCPVS